MSYRRVSSLICAGWLPQDGTFESEWAACLKDERHQLSSNVIAHRSHAGHSQTLAVTTEVSHPDSCGVLVVENGQRPAPAGEFAGDRRVGHDGAFLAFIETGPAGVQTSVGCLTARPGRRGRRLPAPPQLAPRPIPGSVMPGGFDQQAAGMAVAGLGDPALGSASSPRSTRWAPTRGRRRSSARSGVASLRFRRPTRTRSTWRPRADTPAGSLPG